MEDDDDFSFLSLLRSSLNILTSREQQQEQAPSTSSSLINPIISETSSSPLRATAIFSGLGESLPSPAQSMTMESPRRARSAGGHGQHDGNSYITENLRGQHQREKQELTELNDRFRGYLDRVKVLEGKNSQLTNQLEDLSKSWGAASQGVIAQYGSPLDRLRRQLNDSMMDEGDYQARLRRSQQNIENYRTLIQDETAWNDHQEAKREQLKFEYEHSCAELAALQTSYKQVEDQLKYLVKQKEDHLNEIDQLNEQFYQATLDRIKTDLAVQTLREEIPFLNEIYTTLVSEFEQLKPTNGIDTQLFYRQELEKAIRDIRRDFESLHNAQRKEMEDYYNIKIEEIHNDAKKLLPSRSQHDDPLKSSEQLKVTKSDINDTQKLLIQEKNLFKDLQDRLGKLEEEYEFVRNQRQDANDSMNRDISRAQDDVQQLTNEIDTVLRSNITLESEINIYRRLLDSETKRLTQQPIEPVASPEPTPASFGSELGKVFNKKIKKGPIAIKTFSTRISTEDCAPDGKCITLENTSMEKEVDVSNWVLKRRVEGAPEISYTIPYSLVMKPANELKIFARSAQNAHHRPPYQVVNDKLESWGMGTECETKLFNEQGEEKASHSQKIVFGAESSRTIP